ncbi:MAG: thymidine kinase [Planctomycetota bacterium]|jgi:thymidine kinase
MTQSSSTGYLTVIHGSMFAGKTEHTIARLRKEVACGKRVIAFKHSIDDRYDADHLVTHRGDRFEAVRARCAEFILEQSGEADVVAIDEGHFFATPLIAVVEKLLEQHKHVLVAGITNDAWGRPFDPMPQLVALATEEVCLRAPCRICGKPSPYNQRMVPVNTPHMVGGLDEYEPRCAFHFAPLPGPPEER